MKVKIGNTIYDSNKEPIMLILSDQDKENIAKMLTDAHHYCSFPSSMSVEEAKDFMQLSAAADNPPTCPHCGGEDWHHSVECYLGK